MRLNLDWIETNWVNISENYWLLLTDLRTHTHYTYTLALQSSLSNRGKVKFITCYLRSHLKGEGLWSQINFGLSVPTFRYMMVSALKWPCVKLAHHKELIQIAKLMNWLSNDQILLKALVLFDNCCLRGSNFISYLMNNRFGKFDCERALLPSAMLGKLNYNFFFHWRLSLDENEILHIDFQGEILDETVLVSFNAFLVKSVIHLLTPT